jgi:hypothetical protein
MKYKLFFCIFCVLFVISCNNSNNDININKYFIVDGVKYEIKLGNDKHEYYSVYTYTKRTHHLHYPDCDLCKQRLLNLDKTK